MSNAADIGSYVSARDAASRVHLHADYIARLARHSKIKAHQVKRRWYVDMDSLDAFLAASGEAKVARRAEMQEERKREYAAQEESETPTITDNIEEVITEKVTPRTRHVVANTLRHSSVISAPGMSAHAMGYVIHPGTDLLHRLVALITAFVVVVGAYGMFDREFGTALGDSVAYSASAGIAAASVAHGAPPNCNSPLQRAVAFTTVSLENLVISIDNAMPSNLADRHAHAVSSCSK